uniref:ANK_REP_REGION domain-containing protein n=1 Tax=Ascaris lumbricoides TaxID=6252 RepID=A0A0M3ILT0_ASCLU
MNISFLKKKFFFSSILLFQLLYLAKKGDWDLLEESLKSDQRFDFSITDSDKVIILCTLKCKHYILIF